MTVDGPTVVLIAGVSRSGSTMLDLVLGNRTDAFSCGEVYAWCRPFRPHHLRPTCHCGAAVDACPVWRRVGPPKERSLHETISRVTGATTVVDSSKNLAWVADVARWSRHGRSSTRVVLAWRHPQQVAHSYWKRGDRSWAEHLLTYVERLDGLGHPYVAVSIDRLITDAPAVLAATYDHLGGAYLPGQERFWEGDFHHLFGSGSTHAQIGRATGALTPSEVPASFLDHWHQLPPALRSRLDELDERLTADGPVTRIEPPRASPPWRRGWYLRARTHALRSRAALRSTAKRAAVP